MSEHLIEDLTYEEAMVELEALVEAAEVDDLPLHSLIKNFERGQQLVTRCRTLLKDAELTLQKLDIQNESLEAID